MKRGAQKSERRKDADTAKDEADVKAKVVGGNGEAKKGKKGKEVCNSGDSAPTSTITSHGTQQPLNNGKPKLNNISVAALGCGDQAEAVGGNEMCKSHGSGEPRTSSYASDQAPYSYTCFLIELLSPPSTPSMDHSVKKNPREKSPLKDEAEPKDVPEVKTITGELCSAKTISVRLYLMQRESCFLKYFSARYSKPPKHRGTVSKQDYEHSRFG